MNLLLIGSGGREHAIAWKLSQSPRLSKLYIAPGNPGTAALGENASLDAADHPSVVKFCKVKKIDLVVVGPEAPLAEGLVDSLSAAGIRCFGPHKAAAQIEASKAFAKAFMLRHAIPSARFETFTDFNAAAAHLEQVDYPVVIKASGLAAGKGVILPATREEALTALEGMLVRGDFGPAGREVVIEERLSGPEVSLMAFTDGKTVVPMPAAQDHKRLLDGDRGPNTGGMGAYAPAPILTPQLSNEALSLILQSAVDGLREERRPFTGVLYAGLMLTPEGPRVLEFNCRFGDPETQAVLPLLESDLLEVVDACVDCRLDRIDLRWKPGSAACIVLASKGYPETPEIGKPVAWAGELPEGSICFHAGTKADGNGRLLTGGGRVFGVTAWAGTLVEAVESAYEAVRCIQFEGVQYRNDIAARALPKSAYAQAGVDIGSGNRAVELMKEAVRQTYSPAVLAGIGSFGGLFDGSRLKDMKSPVLVASTDGVGTKVKLAAQAGRYRSIGHDIVNHCINDILVQGAAPLFFMDYFAAACLDPRQAAEVVTGIAEACKAAGMALLGGETAEMPGVYRPAQFDVAGTIIGVVERERILPRPDLGPGDVMVGLASSGPHTNGYSLLRKIFTGVPLETIYPELGISLEQALLAPHRSYLEPLEPVLPYIKALAHITGGGFIENIPRVLPAGLDAVVRRGSWPVPPLWRIVQDQGAIAAEEMFRVFNMGIGMVVIVGPAEVNSVRGRIGEETWEIGKLAGGSGKVILQ
jgi:phosphoribosylamine--glycine ligase/phosphoribosylformylglycinamidine cyclo-ligase